MIFHLATKVSVPLIFSGRKRGRRSADSVFLEILEPRVLFSADVMFAVSDVHGDLQIPEDFDFAIDRVGNADVETRFEVIFIDLQVPDYSPLVDEIRSNQNDAIQYQLAFIEADENGVDKIAQILSGIQSVDAVHIISHGTAAYLQLGNVSLSHTTFDQNAASIAAWGDGLGSDADLLFYGCDLAASEEGVHLLDRLSTATGADVAASSDLTGHTIHGGDWILEKEIGAVEAQIPFSDAVLHNYSALLAVSDITDINSGIEMNNNGGNSAYLYADVPIDPTDTHEALTVEVKFATNNSLTTSTLLSHVTSTEQIELSIRSDGSLLFAINGQNSISSAMDYRLLADGGPHALAVTWGTEGFVEIYVDGESVDALSGVAAGFAVNLSGTTVIGQNQLSTLSGFDSNEAFSGVLHDVRIWKEVRSGSEISLNTHYKLNAIDLPDTLVANWQMNGLSATNQVDNVVDASGLRNLHIGDITAAGFIADQVVAGLTINDTAAVNDVVGYVTPSIESAVINIVSDGRFVDHGFPQNSHTEVFAGNSFGQWNVVSGGVEVDTGRDLSPSPLGGGVVDMNGTVATDPGIMEQSIPTAIGKTYQVVFAMSGSGTGGEATKDLRVGVAGTTVDYQFEIDPAWAVDNMMWKHQSMEFTATSTLSTLRFESLETDFWGAVIGDVQVVELPEYAVGFNAVDAVHFYDAITDKFYKRTISDTESWLTAQSKSMATLLNAKPGQLMTIGSAYENDIALEFAKSVGSSIWIGSSDAHAEGEWYWLSGDQPDKQFWRGDTTGSGVAGMYENWASNDPNLNEDYGVLNIDGEWQDDPGNVPGYSYITEWGIEDLARPYTYSLLDDAGGLFSIDMLSGAVSVASAGLDHVVSAAHDITVLVADEFGNQFSKRISITVVGPNQSPVLVENITTQVAEKNAVPITASQLQVSDADNTASEISYTIDSPPLYGRLAFVQAPWAAIDSFTQQDIDDGRLVYVNTTVALSDSFQFKAVDGGEDGSTAITGTFELSIKGNAAPYLSSGIELNSDGGNDAYLVSDPIGVSNLDEITVETIFSGSVTADNVPLFQLHDDSSQALYIGIDTTVGSLVLSVGTSQLFSSTVMDYTDALLDGSKHSLTMTWAGGSESIVLYVDGIEVDKLNNIGSGSTLDLVSDKVVLGQSDFYSPMSPEHIFSGNYYDVRLWDHDLSATDIAKMHDKKYLQPMEGLVANWQMDGFNETGQIENELGLNYLSVMHATGNGFIFSEARPDLNVDENSSPGTSVGHLLVHHAESSRNVVRDGDFSDAGVPLTSIAYGTGQVVGGWDVVDGSVDTLRADGVYTDSTLLGGNSIRLTDADSAISQTVPTEAGRIYQLNYSVAADFAVDTTAVKLLTSAGNQINEVTVPYDPQWNLSDNIMWRHESVLIVADSHAASLEFRSIDPGVMISNVRVTEIPLTVAGVLASQPNMTYDAVTGKFYKTSPNRTTFDGTTHYAENQLVNGISSRLATIHSAYENAVVHSITSHLTDAAWLGASDAAVEGEWQWNYPDAQAERFWSGAVNGTPVSDAYSNWKPGEPNDYQASGGEDFATMDGNGYWNDEPLLTGLNYVVVEWDVNSTVNVYDIQSLSGSGFSIDSSNGEVQVNGSVLLDHEPTPVLNLELDIANLSGESVSQAVEIEVNDINEPPIGNDAEVDVNEDDVFSFPVSAFSYTDSESDEIFSVIIESLPTKGLLSLNGVGVSIGQEILLSKIPTLEYKPAVNEFSLSYDSIEFRVRDDGGTVKGGVDTDPVPRRLTFNVLSVNDAPSGTNAMIGTSENTSYVFKQADFGFSDVDEDVLDAIVITAVNGSGGFLLNDMPLAAGQIVTAANIDANLFSYAPSLNVNGDSIAELEFKVRDSGGTNNNGVNLDPVANKIVFSVSSVNNAPSGKDGSVVVTEDIDYIFNKNDFGFTDAADNNSFSALKIESLPSSGELLLDFVSVFPGQLISVVDVEAGRLVYSPAPNHNGNAAASFDFKVRDDGGVTGGGNDTSVNANKLVLNVLSVNDAPSGSDRLIAISEDSNFRFSEIDFPVTDVESDTLAAVTITKLPNQGLLEYSGNAVTLGQVISASALSDLLFKPDADEYGYAYGSFGFKVADSGGVLRGGQETAVNSNEIVFDVLRVNDAPVGFDNTIELLEDTAYQFDDTEFGFTDADGDGFSSVTITTLPTVGGLWLDGAKVFGNQAIEVDDLVGLEYRPATNANGVAYTGFNFRVQDDGGTIFGGVDTDPLEKSITIDVIEVNDPPSGTDSTVVAFEDSAYGFSRADFGFTDIDGDEFATVIITALPTTGELTHQGVAVYAGQVLNADSIADLKYLPPADANGLAYVSFTFRVQDTGGSSNGGIDTDQNESLITIDLIEINDAPTGSDSNISINENTSYSFLSSDFGFADTDNNNFSAVVVTSAPDAGTLALSGSIVVDDQSISATDIVDLVYTPPVDYAGETDFSFKVRDDGGTANGGSNTAAVDNTIALSIENVNLPPSGTNGTISVNEDQVYEFKATDFGFTDVDGDSFAGVSISSLPAQGVLSFAGAPVVFGQLVGSDDIENLRYTPDAEAHGIGYAVFSFVVRDTGGTGNGGIDTDPTFNMITINVNPVNDAPSGADKTLFVLEDSQHVFSASEFGFSDADLNGFLSVQITSLPVNGSLLLSNSPVSENLQVSVSTLSDLVFIPSADANGPGYASIGFKVRDDGGIALGGKDSDATENTITFDVLSVNDAPSGTDRQISIVEDKNYLFNASVFGFSDAEGNGFAGLKIATLPEKGVLSLSQVPVASGQTIAAWQLSELAFSPEPNDTGLDYAGFEFVVQDVGGITNGGVDSDQTPNVVGFDVLGVNDAPTAANSTVTLIEDNIYRFHVSDFGFSDIDGDSFAGLKITMIPGNGRLELSGSVIADDQLISVSDISELSYLPAAGEHGLAFDRFEFKVLDSGGTSNGGENTSLVANVVTLNVLSVNDAPSGSSGAILIREDEHHVFNETDFGFSDTDDHNFMAVTINNIPAVGSLFLNGVPVVDGQSIDTVELSGLTYAPTADEFGNAYAQLEFSVQDDGGIEIGGTDTDPVSKSITINVLSVNDAPAGSSDTILIKEDELYRFNESEFGFSDTDDHSFMSVIIDSVPAAGSLVLNGVPVVDGQSIDAVELSGLTYAPAADEFGNAYAQLEFSVQDDGGIELGGSDTDPVSNSITINVLGVNDAPSSSDISIVLTEDRAYAFSVNDFEFNDHELDGFQSIVVGDLPTRGALNLAGVAVVENQTIAVSELDALVFTPESNGNGVQYSNFQFRVQDDGGKLNGGENTDPVARLVSIDVTAVNDAPAGVDNTVNVVEDSEYIVSLQDFGYTDIDGDSFLGVSIDTLPLLGELLFQGTEVSSGDLILAVDIDAGALVFRPTADATGQSAIEFHVHDSGGLLNGGADTDPIVRQLMFNVTNVGDAPEGSDSFTRLLEDSSYTLTVADFGYSDQKDNDLMAGVIIDRLPEHGELTLGGLPVAISQSVPVSAIESGQLRFIPELDNSTDTAIDFRVVDSSQSYNTDLSSNRLVVNLESVNDAPKGQDSTVQIEEDTDYVIKISDFGFSDISDDDALATVILGETPLQGAMLLGGKAVLTGQEISASDVVAGRLVFSPGSNDFGQLNSFGFYVTDDGEHSNGGLNTDVQERIISFDIKNRNDAPNLTISAATLDEGSTITLSNAELSATDVDNDINGLIYTIVSPVRHGVIIVDGQTLKIGDQFGVTDLINNRVSYVHDGSEVDSDDMLISLSDGGEDGVGPVEGRLVFNIVEVMDAPPSVTDDQVELSVGEIFDSTSGGKLLSGGTSVLDNDAQLTDAEQFRITLHANPSHGTVNLGEDGSFVYQHDGSENYVDEFSYKVTNQDGAFGIATVRINVEPELSPAVELQQPLFPIFGTLVDPVNATALVVEGIGAEQMEVEQAEVESIEDGDPNALGESEMVALLEVSAQIAELPPLDSEASVLEVQRTNDAYQRVSTQFDFIGGLEDLLIRQHNSINTVALELENIQSTVSSFRAELNIDLFESGNGVENVSFRRALGQVTQELDEAETHRERRIEIGSDAALGASISVSAGALAWVLRGGSLFASLMSAAPLWSTIDPVKLMRSDRKKSDTDNAESVERIFD